MGDGPDDLAQEGGTMGPGVRLEEGDVGGLGDPVDGEEHEELAAGHASFAGVDVDASNGGLGEALPP